MTHPLKGNYPELSLNRARSAAQRPELGWGAASGFARAGRGVEATGAMPQTATAATASDPPERVSDLAEHSSARSGISHALPWRPRHLERERFDEAPAQDPHVAHVKPVSIWNRPLLRRA